MAVRIPIDSFMHVAEAVKRLKANGEPMDELFVEVSSGQMELRDEGGTYGVRRFDEAGG